MTYVFHSNELWNGGRDLIVPLFFLLWLLSSRTGDRTVDSIPPSWPRSFGGVMRHWAADKLLQYLQRHCVTGRDVCDGQSQETSNPHVGRVSKLHIQTRCRQAIVTRASVNARDSA